MMVMEDAGYRNGRRKTYGGYFMLALLISVINTAISIVLDYGVSLIADTAVARYPRRDFPSRVPFTAALSIISLSAVYAPASWSATTAQAP